MSKLLFDTNPLVVDPDLAVKIGLNEAIILQQIHYWIKINESKNRNNHDGYFWAYNTYSQWHKQFPFWSERTIQRIILSLEKNGLITSANYNKLKIDKTKWYRINYETLKTLDAVHDANLALPARQVVTIHDANLALPLPKIKQKITSENTKELNGFQKETFENLIELKDFCETYYKDEEKKDVILYYGDKYKINFGSSHQKLPLGVWRSIENSLFECDEIDDDLTFEYMEAMINRHFIKKYTNEIDYCILHFNTPGIKKVLFYESCY
jgi:hypothetical protein